MNFLYMLSINIFFHMPRLICQYFILFRSNYMKNTYQNSGSVLIELYEFHIFLYIMYLYVHSYDMYQDFSSEFRPTFKENFTSLLCYLWRVIGPAKNPSYKYGTCRIWRKHGGQKQHHLMTLFFFSFSAFCLVQVLGFPTPEAS